MAKTVYFNIEIRGTEKEIQKVGLLEKQLAKLKNQRAELNRKLKDGERLTQEETRELGRLNSSIKNLQSSRSTTLQQLQRQYQANTSVKGSMAALRAETNAMIARTNNLNLTNAKGRAEFQRLRTQIQKNQAQIKQFDQSMGRFQGNVGNYAGGIKTAFQGISVGIMKAVAAIAVLRGAFRFFSNLVEKYDEQERAIRGIEQAIKSTGNAARLSTKQLAEEAAKLQQESIFGDEDILNNVTRQILTFTNISGENFLRTQRAALDLSTVLGTDLKSASIQLGKALNDPIANLSALSRSGIQFSTEQKETIKVLAETNRLAEAQTIILDELSRQYGGQFAEAAKTSAAAWKQLGNSWGDFQETLGESTGGFQKVALLLKAIVDAQNEFSKANERARQGGAAFNDEMALFNQQMSWSSDHFSTAQKNLYRMGIGLDANFFVTSRLAEKEEHLNILRGESVKIITDYVKENNGLIGSVEQQNRLYLKLQAFLNDVNISQSQFNKALQMAVGAYSTVNEEAEKNKDKLDELNKSTTKAKGAYQTLTAEVSNLSEQLKNQLTLGDQDGATATGQRLLEIQTRLKGINDEFARLSEAAPNFEPIFNALDEGLSFKEDILLTPEEEQSIIEDADFLAEQYAKTTEGKIAANQHLYDQDLISQAQYNVEKEALERELLSKEIAIQKLKEKAKISIALNTFSVIKSLSQEGSAFFKAAAIGEALVNAYLAGSGAYESAMNSDIPYPLNFILAFTSGAVALAEGFAAVNSIKQVKMATGGLVQGQGTGRSDSVPAMLSNGEAVINSASMSSTDNLSLSGTPRQIASELNAYKGYGVRFATGGLVGQAQGNKMAKASALNEANMEMIIKGINDKKVILVQQEFQASNDRYTKVTTAGQW